MDNKQKFRSYGILWAILFFVTTIYLLQIASEIRFALKATFFTAVSYTFGWIITAILAIWCDKKNSLEEN